MGFLRSLLNNLFNLTIFCFYLASWGAFIAALSDRHWVEYEIGEYKNYDGLWEHCYVKIDAQGNNMGESKCEFNMGITQLLDNGSYLDQPLVEETIYTTELVQICVVRVAVIIACLMPFVGLVSAICRNRFFGYVSMMVSGMFGLLSFAAYFYYYMSLFSLKYDEVSDTPSMNWNNYFPNSRLDYSFWLMVGGTILNFGAGFVECCFCSNKYRKAKIGNFA